MPLLFITEVKVTPDEMVNLITAGILDMSRKEIAFQILLYFTCKAIWLSK